MKKNSSFQSALFNPRVLLAFALCSIGVGLAMLSFAATPPSGMDKHAGPLSGNAKAAAASMPLAPAAPAVGMSLEWARFYDGGAANHDWTRALALDASGNLFVTGLSTRLNDAGAFKIDIATIKYSPSGDVLWLRRFDGSQNSNDQPSGMVVDPSGNVYVTGCAGDAGQLFNYMTLKYDPLGNLLWSSKLDVGGNTCAQATVFSKSGYLYVTGGSIDFATVKYDSTGQIQWVRHYGNYGAHSIALDGQENIYVAGTTVDSSGNNKLTVVKYNSSGVLQWAKMQNNMLYTSSVQTGLSVSENGDVIVIGYGYSLGDLTKIDYVTIKYDSAGTQLWEAYYNDPGNCDDVANAVAVDPSGNVYVTGYDFKPSAPRCTPTVTNRNSTDIEFATIKYDPAGKQLWVAQYYGGYGAAARSVVLDDAGNIIVSGSSDEFSDICGVPKTYIVTIKYDADGKQLSMARYLSHTNDSQQMKALVSGSDYYIANDGRPTTCGDGYEDFLTLKYGPPPVHLNAVVSRKVHGSAGTFDVDLPLTGPRGIECRNVGALPGGATGDYQLVFSFANPLTSVDSVSASAMSPSGPQPVSSSGSIGTDPHQYIVTLSMVPNAQYMTVTLANVNDAVGNFSNAVSASMGVLIGDVNATGLVDGNDVSAVQGQARQSANSTNFRLDVNTTGLIDGNDVSLTQSHTRTSLPSPP